MNNLNEIICEAIDIISSQNIKSVQFDTTILCTIDKSLGNNGYTVMTDSGNAGFTAYAVNGTEYKEGDRVYVTIPQGDYNQQKFITAKYVNEDGYKAKYLRPLDKMLDVTGNVISNANEGDWIILNTQEQGYTYMGVKASFQTSGVPTGEYGLQIEALAGTQISLNPKAKPDKVTVYKIMANEKPEDTECVTYHGPFANGDISYLIAFVYPAISDNEWTEFANKYSDDAFEMSYNIYRLSSKNMIGNTSQFIGFFSQEDIFNIEGYTIEAIQYKLYKEDSDNVEMENPQIYFGYSMEDYANGGAFLFTSDTSSYGPQDQKRIVLRWIVQNEDGRAQVVSVKPENASIYWYQYEASAPTVHPWSGVSWKYLESNQDQFDYTFTPSAAVNSEKIKVVIVENETQYTKSNVIEFTNANPGPEFDLGRYNSALGFKYSDNLNGKYFIYNKANSLYDEKQGRENRTISLLFKDPHIENATYVDLAQDSGITKITWEVPVNNSMINILNTPTTNIVYYTREGKVIESENTTAQRYRARFEQVGNSDEALRLHYKIKTRLYPSNSNNTIICIIEKDGRTFQLVEELLFGTFGTSGTNVTFVLDFAQGSESRFIANNQTQTLTIEPSLIDGEGVPQQIPSISYQWVNQYSNINSSSNIDTAGIEGNTIVWTPTEDDLNSLFLLKATITGWGNYDLIQYLAIPVAAQESYYYLEGPTQIIYLSDGTFSYDASTPYKLRGYHESEIIASIYPNETENPYQPIIKNNRLIPKAMYVDGTSICGVQIKDANGNILWIEPIIISQNRYPSAMIDGWDESLIIDNENGAILSTMIAAGSKNQENQFSGVLMGDWRKSDSDPSITKQTGLYGFQNGKMSYALRENGTGFMGGGAGIIEFDGSNGSIKMNNTNTDGHIYLDSSKTAIIDGAINYHETVPLCLGSESNNSWFNVDYHGNVSTGGNIYMTGHIELNGIKIGEGTLTFGEDQAQINLKDNSDNNGETPGAIGISAPLGLSIKNKQGGLLYIRSTGVGRIGNDTGNLYLTHPESIYITGLYDNEHNRMNSAKEILLKAEKINLSGNSISIQGTDFSNLVDRIEALEEAVKKLQSGGNNTTTPDSHTHQYDSDTYYIAGPDDSKYPEGTFVYTCIYEGCSAETTAKPS